MLSDQTRTELLLAAYPHWLFRWQIAIVIGAVW